MSATASFFLLESERDTTPPAESNPGKAGVSCQIDYPRPYKVPTTPPRPRCCSFCARNPSRLELGLAEGDIRRRAQPLLSEPSPTARTPWVSSPSPPPHAHGLASRFGARNGENRCRRRNTRRRPWCHRTGACVQPAAGQG